MTELEHTTTVEAREFLGTAIDILEKLPLHIRPERDIKDMRALLRASKTDIDGARQAYIFVEAMTTVLAKHALTSGRWNIDEPHDRNHRQKQLETLFAKLASADPQTVAVLFDQACRWLRTPITEGRIDS
jgi:hypothetical protein